MPIDTSTTDLRLQLLANGYKPIPNADKACYMKGWPKVIIDEDEINRWSRMHNTNGTGLRVEDGLCVIDIDIDHPIIEDIAEVMLAVLPQECFADRLERAGKGHKLAWYVQSDEMFSRLHTRRWVAPGDTEDEGTHCIEIFGGGSVRQFGSFGPHTLGDDGKASITYKWSEETPADVPLDALPIITKDQLFAMLDAAEAELKVQGFTPVQRTERGEGSPQRIYDLTEDMTFHLAENGDGEGISLAELTEKVRAGWTGRCSASFLEGPSAQNRQRCLITKSSANFVAIWESASGNTHMPASIAPVDVSGQVDRLAEKIRQRKDSRRARLSSEDDHISAAAKMLMSYAFIPTMERIVPLWDASKAVKVGAMRQAMSPYCGVEVGPRGGEKRVNPVDVWLSNSQRILADGVMMRPDKPRPTYTDESGTWVNTYSPPDLGSTDGGTLDVVMSFFDGLIPDEREREWFFDWLAYKWQNPHIPGPSIIMVAKEFGTGRGTFGDILAALFGDEYCIGVNFSIFAGLNYQSQYTDWGMGKLFAIVNESSATGDQSSYRTKNNVYEHLKEIVDPRPTLRTYVSKGGQSGPVRAMSATTNVIMTNNNDAVPLPKDDRRFAVLTNGGKRDPEFFNVLNQWMGLRCNIAALGAWLSERSVDGYNPFEAPLWTRAKEEMSELNETVLDKLIAEALSSMSGMFVVEQVLRRMAQMIADRRQDVPEKWKLGAEREIRRLCSVVRYSSGRKLNPQINGRRYDVFAKTDKTAKQYEGATDLHRRLIANGNVFGGSDALTEKLKRKVK